MPNYVQGQRMIGRHTCDQEIQKKGQGYVYVYLLTYWKVLENEDVCVLYVCVCGHLRCVVVFVQRRSGVSNIIPISLTRINIHLR